MKTAEEILSPLKETVESIGKVGRYEKMVNYNKAIKAMEEYASQFKVNKSLNQKAVEYVEWLDKLKQVASDKLNINPSEVKINEGDAFKYYNDGFTPTQCFRESY